MKPSTKPLRCDFYIEAGGIALTLSIPPERQLERFVFERWNPWLVEKPSCKIAAHILALRAPKARFRYFKNTPDLQYDYVFRMRQALSLLKFRGGRAHCFIFGEKTLRANFFYFGAIELMIHSLLRRFNVFPMHGSGVALNGRSVVILGESGAGKSTTAAHFLPHGFLPLSDDDIILKAAPKGPLSLGKEKGLFVHRDALPELSGLEKLRVLGQRKKAHKIKKFLSSPPAGHDQRKPAISAVKIILFPSVRRRTPTRLLKLSPGQALIKLLGQWPDSWKNYVNDPVALKNLFLLYSSLSIKCACYQFIIGKNYDAIRKQINFLANQCK